MILVNNLNIFTAKVKLSTLGLYVLLANLL